MLAFQNKQELKNHCDTSYSETEFQVTCNDQDGAQTINKHTAQQMQNTLAQSRHK